MTYLATWHSHEVTILDCWCNPMVDTEFATVRTLDETQPFKCYSSHSYEHPGMEPAWSDTGIVLKDELEDVSFLYDGAPIDQDMTERLGITIEVER